MIAVYGAVLAATTIQLNPQLVAIVGGVIVPLLVGAVTKLNASSAIKAILNFGLSALAGGIATISTTGTIANWQTWVASIAVAWGTSILSYYGLWKPTGTSTAVQKATKSFGFGRVQIEIEPGRVPIDPNAPAVLVNGQTLTHVNIMSSGLPPEGGAESTGPSGNEQLLRTAIDALTVLAEREKNHG